MAPEIVRGNSYSGAHVDVWSLGVALATMLTGTLPFQGAGDNELKKRILRGTFACPEHVSDDAKDLLSRMLAIAPEHRIELAAIKQHPWLKPYADARTGTDAPSDAPRSGAATAADEPLDEEVMAKLVAAGLDATIVERDVRANAYSHESACYEMLYRAAQAELSSRQSSSLSAPPPPSAFSFFGVAA
jgi:5'-AMP-activated protein kinase catalytic alpha subunit